MIKLRKEIKSSLQTICDRVYYQNATKKEFPFIVYDFPNSFMDGGVEVFNLDVDVWDNKNDTTEIETLASKIWKLYNCYYHIDKFIQFRIYRDNRLPPLDEKEKNIKRRKLVFQLRYLNREDY